MQVSVPDMPWTIAHLFDRGLEEALDEVAAAVEHSRAHGANRVVVVGHRFGGGAAVGFGALRGGIESVAALAPGPDPASIFDSERRAESVAKARAMIAGATPTGSRPSKTSTGWAWSVASCPMSH